MGDVAWSCLLWCCETLFAPPGFCPRSRRRDARSARPLALPIRLASLYVFALVMGATWLGTVPLTSGVVEQVFGVRYIGTLFALVFLGHQLGGFFGAWLGGSIYDTTHSYAWMWAIAIALGAASVLLDLPISDRSIERRLEPAAA